MTLFLKVHSFLVFSVRTNVSLEPLGQLSQNIYWYYQIYYFLLLVLSIPRWIQLPVYLSMLLRITYYLQVHKNATSCCITTLFLRMLRLIFDEFPGNTGHTGRAWACQRRYHRKDWSLWCTRSTTRRCPKPFQKRP